MSEEVVEYPAARAVPTGWPTVWTVSVEVAGVNPSPREPTMTVTIISLSEPREKHDEGDFLRAAAGAVLQLIMETDVAGVIGAGRTERAEGRTTSRTGYRDRALDTRLATPS